VKPVVVTQIVARPPDEVFDYLAALRNRPDFTDHFLVDWSFSGATRGVGAKARTRIHASVAKDWVEMEIVETKTPTRIREHSVGAKGKRLTIGEWRLAPADGGTRVEYETYDETAPPTERVMHPVQRPWLRRVNAKALERLKAELESG
jgi:uncharacterized protein YndB with AHSA1/START domain